MQALAGRKPAGTMPFPPPTARVAGSKPSDQDLLDHCKPLLGLRSPRRFGYLDALPKNANGKVDKPKLKDQRNGSFRKER